MKWQCSPFATTPIVFCESFEQTPRLGKAGGRTGVDGFSCGIPFKKADFRGVLSSRNHCDTQAIADSDRIKWALTSSRKDFSDDTENSYGHGQLSLTVKGCHSKDLPHWY